MERAPAEVLDGLKDFDSATVFNAVVEAMGGWQGSRELEGKGGQPQNYTDPELGSAVGYAVTLEIAPNDPDAVAMDQHDHYEMLDRTPGPLLPVVKDVDPRPGRGAALGDGDAAMRKALGATGILVEGSVRDLAGIRRSGIPVWSTAGTVPGHGVFSLVRHNAPITIAGLRMEPDDLLVADEDGCTKIPRTLDPAEVLRKAIGIRARETDFHEFVKSPEFNLQQLWKLSASWRDQDESR